MTDSWSDSRFRSQVNAALERVRKVLDTNRAPTFPDAVHHKYVDKFLLAQFMTNTALAAHLNCLEHLGLNAASLKKLKEWSGRRSVTVRVKGEEKCEFDREHKYDVDSATKRVWEYESSSGHKSKDTFKTVTTITEYWWDFTASYEVVAYCGNDPNDQVTLQGRTGRCRVITSTKDTPKPKVSVVPSMDCNITWLLQQIDPQSGQLAFAIDRTAKSCRTPRRNADVETAFRFFREVRSWAQSVHSYFTGRLFPVQKDHGLDLAAINDNLVFVPVVPLFEAINQPAAAKALEGAGIPLALVGSKAAAAGADEPERSVMLPLGDINRFLQEQQRSVAEKFAELGKAFPEVGKDAKLITVQEARLLVVMMHARAVSQHWADAVEYIEDMLRKQLIAAIGKELQPMHFGEYMRFHNRKLFRKAFEPRPFCFAVRRPDHYPEGTVSIESSPVDGTVPDPVYTTVRSMQATHAMKFALNAATNVSFYGDRHLHAFVRHQFSGQSGDSLQLVARARQFSSFIMMVGRIASAELFEPKYAIIVQNKDDLKVSLLRAEFSPVVAH